MEKSESARSIGSSCYANLAISGDDLMTVLSASHDKEVTLYPDLWDKNNPVEFKCIIRSLAIDNLFDSVISSQKLTIDKSYLHLWHNKYEPSDDGNGTTIHYLNYIKNLAGEEKKFDSTDQAFQACGVIKQSSTKKWNRDETPDKRNYFCEILSEMNLAEKIDLLTERMKKNIANLLDIQPEALDEYLLRGERLRLSS
ncbi:MAG: hypothetical protein NTX91_02745 [candidate division SR1 bacterium]|nr:hypothetical protein [candidate division SR1 bacterium]